MADSDAPWISFFSPAADALWAGVRVGAKVEGLQDLHLRPVKPLQRPLHTDPCAGPGRQGREVRNVRSR